MDGNDPDEDDELVFEDDTLTWKMVSEAIGAEDPIYSTRATTAKRGDKGKGIATRATPSTRQTFRKPSVSSSNVISLVDDDEMEEDLDGAEDNLGYEDDFDCSGYEDIDDDIYKYHTHTLVLFGVFVFWFWIATFIWGFGFELVF